MSLSLQGFSVEGIFPGSGKAAPSKGRPREVVIRIRIQVVQVKLFESAWSRAVADVTLL
jgi:hypothetical protein